MNYLVIRPNEDGNPIQIMAKDEVNELLEEANSEGEAVKIKTGEYTDANYWDENEIMIYELGEQIVPEIKLSI